MLQSYVGTHDQEQLYDIICGGNVESLGGQMDSVWDSEYASGGFESWCCQLVDYVTSLGKMCASPYRV